MTERISGERRAEIKARVEAATPGKWEWVEVHDSYYLSGWNGLAFVLKGQIGGQGNGWVDIGSRDARFIAGARSDVPDLLAALDAAEQRIAELEAALRAAKSDDTNGV